MMQQQPQNLSQSIKNSIFTRNGNFMEFITTTTTTATTNSTDLNYSHGNGTSSNIDDAATILSAPSINVVIERPLSTRDFLLLQWREAIQGLTCCNLSPVDQEAFFIDWFHQLWMLHTSYTTRQYHTAVHLEEMCYYLQLICASSKEEQPQIKELEECKSIILLAIFFHDAIYDPHSDTNEEDSAKLFESFANQANMDPKHTLCIVSYIMATKHHMVDFDTATAPSLLFLDLDMAVLGKDEFAYQQYAALIRHEYDFVPLTTYCEKRANILETFLKRKRIYFTSVLYDAFEDRARRNVTKEIQLLRQGIAD
jgi:predicted metal-dependent HD superfamily phosphohydrolase